METVKSEKQLSELVRMTERVGGENKNHLSLQEFSILNSLKTKEYMKCLNSGKIESKDYNEVSMVKLENIEYREWYDKGFLEGLRFNWSNGCSSMKYAEGIKHPMKLSQVSSHKILRKIKVDYNQNVIIRMQFLDKHDSIIGCQMGSIDEEYLSKWDKVQTKILELNAGEVIIGVNIQEIGYLSNENPHKCYEIQEDKECQEYHIGSIQFQIMQLGQFPKMFIKPDEISEFLVSHKMLGGKQPYNKENPITFSKDNKFITINDGQTGTWNIIESVDAWLLEMKWDSKNAACKFEFVNLYDQTITFICVEASPNSQYLLEWKLNEMPENSRIVRMTLKSHPGKALIRNYDKQKYMHDGHEVRWYKIGEESDASIFIFQNQAFGKSEFQGEIIRITEDNSHALDCAGGCFELRTEVISYDGHKGGNQWFVVNCDNSISPTHAPKMRLGLIKQIGLGLLDENEKDRILIFKEVFPSVDPNQPTLSLIMTCPENGKAIILDEETRQHGHGMEQMLKVGDAQNAIKVFFDEADFIRDSQYTFQAFDGYEHTHRPLEYFTKHNDYPHQQFYLTKEGTIQLKYHLDWFLGLNKTHEKVIFVKESDPNMCVFKDADLYSLTNERLLQTQKPDYQKKPLGKKKKKRNVGVEE